MEKTVESQDGVHADQQEPGEPPTGAVEHVAADADRGLAEPDEIKTDRLSHAGRFG